jgi:formylglycine-generating enzyme required for sulfatase activity
LLKRYTPTGDCPVNGETWFEAAEYCNWLSKQEGLPEDQWCYETNAQGKVLKLKANYLSLPGYRLPTEAEIEYACRAGAATARYYGETDELLKQYAWYLGNAAERTWPVGSLKPNDLGLFDMHGNVWCWCQESYLAYPQSRGGKVIEDIEDKLSINTQESRVLRGGASIYRASYVRSALRNGNVPSFRYFLVGFRPARTLPLDTFTALPPAEGGSAPE